MNISLFDSKLGGLSNRPIHGHRFCYLTMTSTNQIAMRYVLVILCKGVEYDPMLQPYLVELF